MGQIPNKTYTAPDGSVYRVEADGSVTKIKGGRVQSNEPPSKYQISPDGKIYRVESDGSVTYLGNAEDRQYPTPHTQTIDNKRRSNKWGWVIIVAIVIVAASIGMYVSNQSYSTYDNYNDSNIEEYSAVTETPYGNSDNSTEYVEQQNTASSKEVPANESEQWAFIEDGSYYGSIGNVSVFGTLNLPTENPEGTLHYSGSDGEFYISGTSDGRYWTEYYGDEITGEIYFDFWDIAYKNFARGTYTRNSDGKQFSIKLYKTNF